MIAYPVCNDSDFSYMVIGVHNTNRKQLYKGGATDCTIIKEEF